VKSQALELSIFSVFLFEAVTVEVALLSHKQNCVCDMPFAHRANVILHVERT
jgi:hypothetical protein